MIKKALAQSAEEPDQDDIKPYETEGHMKTLMDAHDIMNDGAKMEKVHALAGRHSAALKGLKKLANTKAPKVKSLDDLKAAAANFNKPGGYVKDTDNDGE